MAGTTQTVKSGLKICMVCGHDVSNRKRTKDAHGNYFCDSCWQAARAKAAPDVISTPRESSLIERIWDGTGRWLHRFPRRLWTSVANVPAMWRARAARAAEEHEEVEEAVLDVESETAIPSPPTPSSVSTPPPIQKHHPVVNLFAQLLGGAIGIAALIAVVVALNGEKKDAESPNAPVGNMLPTIRVLNPITNKSDDSVSFTNWKIEGFTLSAVMTWKGDSRIDALSYSVLENGVIIDRGSVSVPGGGMRKQEPVQVHLVIMKEIKPEWQVTIEVMH